MNIVATQHTKRNIPLGWMLALVLAAVFCLSGADLYAQIRTITGKVSETGSNTALGGVKITGKGTRAGAFSKKDGTYSIAVPSDAKALVFEYVGFKKKEVAIGSSDELSVQLAEDVLKLEELVVTAVGITQEKKALTYATQEVKSAELTSGRQTNVINALSGQVAGVQINSSSGSPGASTYIRIRGFSSILGNNQPLFVIDGVPVDNSISASNGGSTGGVDVSNRALDINPDDIESINVLKGAAATAIYGIQAGPGAIIITTKRGKNDGTISVNYSYTKTFEEVNKLPDLQTTYGQGTGGNIRRPENGTSQSWGPRADSLFWDGNKSYDWDANGSIIGKTAAAGNANAKAFTPYDNLKSFFKTGQTDIHNLNVSGGNNNGTFYLGVAETKNNGIIPNTSLERTTLRLNADYKLGADWKVGATVQYARTNQVAVERGSNVGGIMLGLLRTPITFDNANSAAGVTSPGTDLRAATFAQTSSRYLDAAGYVNQRTYRGTGIYDNPFWAVQQTLFHSLNDRTLGNGSITYAPADWFGKDILGNLAISYRLGGDFYTTNSYQNLPRHSSNGTSGSVLNVDERNQIVNSDLLITFNKEFSPDFSMNLALGNNAYQNIYQSYRVYSSNLALPDFYNISNAADAPTITQFYQSKRTGALFATASFNFKETLILNGTVRNEWSTTLPVANQTFLSYSASASFIFTELLKDAIDPEFLSFGKIRASYAKNGQDAFIYSLSTPFNRANIADGWVNYGITFPVKGVSGFQKSQTLGSGDLRAESKTEFEIGTELKFFQNRFSLDFTYYANKVADNILYVPVAYTSGYAQRTINAATMENSGVELVLNAAIIQTDDFRLNAQINFSTLKNKVTGLAPGVPNVFLGGFSSGGAYAQVGQPYGEIFGSGWKRNAQGQAFIGSDGFPIPTDTIAGYGVNIPDWQAGVRLSASWKGLSISGLLDIKKGGQIWNGTRGALNNFGRSKDSENRYKSTFSSGGLQIVDNVFQGVQDGTADANNSGGKANTVKVANIGQNWWGNLGIYNNFNSTLAEPLMEDAGWVRLREVTVSYQFPKDIVSSIGFLTNLEVFATGRNLWLSTNYTGVDPETSLTGARNSQGIDYFNNPGTRSYSFGIKVGF